MTLSSFWRASVPQMPLLGALGPVWVFAVVELPLRLPLEGFDFGSFGYQMHEVEQVEPDSLLLRL